MHEDQIDIGTDVARALIEKQFPSFRGEPVVAVPQTGSMHAIFRIGADHAARFPLRMEDPDACLRQIERAAEASAEFAAHCPFPSPLPVGIGRGSSAYPLPWLVQTWVVGETATPYSHAASADFALDLAALVASLRAIDTKGRTFDGRGRGGRLPDHDGWMETCFGRSRGLLEVGRLQRMWAHFRALPDPGRVAMSHRDLIPGNLLVRGVRLAGVIDTGDFGPADPSLDLVAGWHLLDRAGRSTFREALRCGDLEWRRGAAWAFQQAMGLVWYYRETNPVMSDLGRSTLRRLLDDEEVGGVAPRSGDE